MFVPILPRMKPRPAEIKYLSQVHTVDTWPIKFLNPTVWLYAIFSHQNFSAQALFNTPTELASWRIHFGSVAPPFTNLLTITLPYAYCLISFNIQNHPEKVLLSTTAQRTHMLENKTDTCLQGARQRCREHEHCAMKVARDRALKDQTRWRQQPNRPFSLFCSICSEEES